MTWYRKHDEALAALGESLQLVDPLGELPRSEFEMRAISRDPTAGSRERWWVSSDDEILQIADFLRARA